LASAPHAGGKTGLRRHYEQYLLLAFLTMEHEEMFDGMMLTPNIVLWISAQNKVMISFYEKEMVSIMVLHRWSAMLEGVRRPTQNQELVLKNG
jgi:hypothetical protein